MNNKNKMILASAAGVIVILLAAAIAGVYAIPFAFVIAAAGVMVFGNHLGVYSLPVATSTILKKAMKLALIAIIAVWAWNIISEKVATKKANEVKVSATGNLTQGVDLSQRREAVISEEIMLPDRASGKKVPLSIPCYRVPGGIMWYQVTLSPTVKVEYDFLDGKATHKDGPGEVLAVERFSPVIHVQAIGEGGKMTVTLTRQFLSDNPNAVVKKSPKKVRSVEIVSVKKQSQKQKIKKVIKEEEDVPKGPQII